MILLLLACHPAGSTDPLASCEPGESSVDLPRLALTYTDRSYSSGALGFQFAPATLEGPVHALSGDAILRSDGDKIYVIDRSSADAISAFDPQSANCPLWQTSLGAGTNAHDLVAVNGRLWVTTFGTGELIELDPLSGELLGRSVIGQTLDRAVWRADRLWVADQRFAIGNRQEGALLEVDLVTRTVLSERAIGPNPRITSVDDGLMVVTGYYAQIEETYAADLIDGELFHYDPVTDVRSEPWLLESDLQGDLHTVVGVEGGVVAVSVDADARSTIRCVIDGQVVEGPSSMGWFIDGVAVDGNVVFATKSGLVSADGTSTPGLMELDPTSCAEVSFVASELEPYSLVSLER